MHRVIVEYSTVKGITPHGFFKKFKDEPPLHKKKIVTVTDYLEPKQNGILSPYNREKNIH